MNQNTNNSQTETSQLLLDDKNAQFIVNLVLDFVYNFNSNPTQYQSGNQADSSLKLVLTGDMAGNIYKTSKNIPPKLTITLVGGDISEDNFQRILKNMKKAFFNKIKEDDERDDYCWLVQFEGIFETELHPAQPANKPANEQANKPKTPKILFEIIEEQKKNPQNKNQQPLQSSNQANPNKKPQLKSGIKLVIESDKKYELPFLEMETATEFPSIQVYPNIFIPNQSGANIGPDDELSCAVLLKLHTYERNKEWIGLNEYKKHRKNKNHPELSQNNSGRTLESLLDSEYQKQYKKKLNEGVNSSFIETMNQNKQKAYNDKIRALYDKCGVFYRKEYNSLFQEKQRMYGIYPNSTRENKRENIKFDEETSQEPPPRLKNGIRVIKTESSTDFVPKPVYSSKFAESKQENEQSQPKLEVSNRFSIQPYKLQISQSHNSERNSPFMKLTLFDYLPHSYEVGKQSSPLFLSDIEKIKLSNNTKEYVLQFRIIPANEYNVQLQFLATKWYMILIKSAPKSSNVFTLYEENYTNHNNKNKTKRRLTNQYQSPNLPKNQYKFYRHKVKLSSIVETYMSIVNEGIIYVCPVSVLVFSESATTTG
jgi:hypothetical protein